MKKLEIILAVLALVVVFELEWNLSKAVPAPPYNGYVNGNKITLGTTSVVSCMKHEIADASCYFKVPAKTSVDIIFTYHNDAYVNYKDGRISNWGWIKIDTLK